jgi:DNA repair protein RadC
MSMKTKSDSELLEVLVGKRESRRLRKRTVGEILGFFKNNDGRICKESLAPYQIHPRIEAAKELVRRGLVEEMGSSPIIFETPALVKDYLRLSLGGQEHESFYCLWLDAQNKLITSEEAFRGTITQTTVHPREVLKAGIRHNAAGVIFSHCHPSGLPEPSTCDRRLTESLQRILGIVDIKVIDHIIVAGNQTVSMAEKGLI